MEDIKYNLEVALREARIEKGLTLRELAQIWVEVFDEAETDSFYIAVKKLKVN